MKTDNEWKEFLLFKLLDVDLTGIKYIAIDFDGEISVSPEEMVTETAELDDGDSGDYWITRSGNGKKIPRTISKVTDIFIDEDCIPDNYATMLIKL